MEQAGPPGAISPARHHLLIGWLPREAADVASEPAHAGNETRAGGDLTSGLVVLLCPSNFRLSSSAEAK
jgi:hypothetical protein